MEVPRKEKNSPPPRNEPYIHPVNGIVQPPVIPPPNRPGRRTNVLEDIKSVLNYIWRSRWSYPFRNPVDAINLRVPDYHQIIKQPMDLGTIKKRLKNNYYWEAEEALQDFNLVFDNCFLYNMEGTPVNQAGKELKTAFYNRLATIDLSNEMELQPKVDKRKRKAAEAPFQAPKTKPLLDPFPTPKSKPVLDPIPAPKSKPPLQVGPSLIPHAMPSLPGMLPNVMPSFMPNTLINPLNPFMQFSNMTTPMTMVKERQDMRKHIPKTPPIRNPLSGLPPSLTRAPIYMPPSPPLPPSPTKVYSAVPEKQKEPTRSPTPPPPKILPPIICYKELDRLIEKSHAVHLLKAMRKRKRRQFTWAFNRADYWARYSPSPDLGNDKEELLDWKVLEERLNSDKFENIDTFVYSVRKMFQNALRWFPDDNLVKVSVKKSNEIFERRLPKCRELIAKAKEHARSVVEAKE
ncbi:hypothetical protein KR074_007241, partial [Drosophila pseudoananassae]